MGSDSACPQVQRRCLVMSRIDTFECVRHILHLLSHVTYDLKFRRELAQPVQNIGDCASTNPLDPVESANTKKKSDDPKLSAFENREPPQSCTG